MLLGSAIVAAIVGVALLAATSSRLVERGITADEQGTAGYTTVGDFVRMGGGILLLVAALGLGVLAFGSSSV